MTYKKNKMDLSDHYQIVLKAVIHLEQIVFLKVVDENSE